MSPGAAQDGAAKVCVRECECERERDREREREREFVCVCVYTHHVAKEGRLA